MAEEIIQQHVEEGDKIAVGLNKEKTDVQIKVTKGRKKVAQETGLTDLCLGGGVALNGVANTRILAESGFERLFVPPAPGDATDAPKNSTSDT